MDKGRNELRNSQVHSITNTISSWGIGVPEDKKLRGFGNDTCGRLLCPSTQDWNDPMFVYITLYLFFLVPIELTPSHRTRERLKSFQLLVTADDFPRFLWE
jgi:hypothetical protein